MNVWDVIVIGVGAVGSFALREASRRGARALGLELAEPAHARGSSHGHCRIFRHAYFEHPDYVPLLRYATRGFEELERERSVQLLHRCGVLLLGKRNSTILSRSLLAARSHGLPVDDLDARDVAQRFPWFASPLAERGVFEQDAGLVRPELAIAAAVVIACPSALVRFWPILATDGLSIPVTVYVSVLAAMVCSALIARLPTVWTAVGAVLFAVSDAMIGIGQFAASSQLLELPIWWVYAASQVLITAGFFVGRNRA
jgi:hypothetical protein